MTQDGLSGHRDGFTALSTSTARVLGLPGQPIRLTLALDPMYVSLTHTCATCGKEVPTPNDNAPIWVSVSRRAGKLVLTYFCNTHRGHS